MKSKKKKKKSSSPSDSSTGAYKIEDFRKSILTYFNYLLYFLHAHINQLKTSCLLGGSELSPFLKMARRDASITRDRTQIHSLVFKWQLFEIGGY